MHFAFVADYLPSPNTSGAGLHLWSMVKCLADRGHRLTYIVVGKPHELYLLDGPELEHLWQSLAELGVRVEHKELPTVSIRVSGNQPGQSGLELVRRMVRQFRGLPQAFVPQFEHYDRMYHVADIQARITDMIQALAVDAIFAFNFGAIGALRGIRSVPRVALPGDPVDQLLWTHLKYNRDANWRGRLSLLLQVAMFRRFPQWLLHNLAGFESVTWTAAHHVEWLRAQGVKQCRYIPTPVPDMVGPDCEAKRSAIPKNKKPKLLHVGHLGGTAAMTGLYLFLEDTLPILEQQLGEDGFEVHFIGRQDMGPSIVRLLNRPNVRLRGFIEDLTYEFLSSDIFVVPIPHRVGMRTRLVTGLSYGCCVVAHENCRLGNPELVHEKNVLLANDGKGLAACILRALRDDNLRKRLRRNARRTYEQHFSLESAGAQYADELERVAREFKGFAGLRT